jgi:hypothetical protein
MLESKSLFQFMVEQAALNWCSFSGINLEEE